MTTETKPSVIPAGKREKVSFTEQGDLVITVPAIIINVLTVTTALVAAVLLPFVAMLAVPVAISLPFALLTTAGLLAVAFVGPLALMVAAASVIR